MAIKNSLDSFNIIKEWKRAGEKPKSIRKYSDTWDVLLDIKEDESFSSWFTRTAKANYSNPIGILDNLEHPKYRIDLNKFDLDFTIKRKTLQKIARLTHNDVSIFLKMCIIPKRNQNGNWMYFTRPIIGSRYCPLCLKEDGNDPYFRLYWRMKCFTVCGKHKIFLFDKCPNCGKPILYWLEDFEHPITSCFFCGKDLLDNTFNFRNEFGKDKREHIKSQEILLEIFKKGAGMVNKSIYWILLKKSGKLLG